MRIKYKAEAERSVVVYNFEVFAHRLSISFEFFFTLILYCLSKRNGWQRVEGDDWNIFWANVHTVRQIFNPEHGMRLNDFQFSFLALNI